MKLFLTPEESEQVFFDSMCNVFGTDYHAGYGLELEYDMKDYVQSRKKMNGEPCWEDVLLQMLKDGKSLTLVDVECDGEYTSTITIKDVYEKVQNTNYNNLINVVEGTGDVSDSDCVIQTVFFGEIIFA